jgi:hypothetical protein
MVNFYTVYPKTEKIKGLVICHMIYRLYLPMKLDNNQYTGQLVHHMSLGLVTVKINCMGDVTINMLASSQGR